MNIRMRLYTRNGWYYVEFFRGKTKSLKTQDADVAQDLFKEIKREHLRGRIIQLDHAKRVSLAR